METTQKLEVFMLRNRLVEFDKWLTGLDPFQKHQKVSYYVEYYRQERRPVPFTSEHALARFYLRLETYTFEEISKTPYRFVDILSLGGVFTVVSLVFGSIGRGCNMMANDSTAVGNCMNSYIAAVAWGDTNAAKIFARMLRWH